MASLLIPSTRTHTHALNAFLVRLIHQCVCVKFKESALRKQSLYLKFDPLLKESPNKAAVDVSGSGFSLPRPSLAIRSVTRHLTVRF